MSRKEFSKATKRLALKRSDQICEAEGPLYGWEEGVLCLSPLSYGLEFDHVLAASNGGDASLDNCLAVCRKCHAFKTRNFDTPRAAKTVRQRVNAVVRFASMEPMLGRVDMCEGLGMWFNSTMNAWEGTGSAINRDQWGNKKLHMVISGGESGGVRRNVDHLIEHITSLDRQCEAASIAHFVKQDAAFRDGQQGRIPDWLWAKKQMPEVK